MNGRDVRQVTLWLVVGLAILGCASPVLLTPPPTVPVSEPLETIIVQTAAVAQTQTARVLPPTWTATTPPLPTKTPTVTPTPTATVLFLPPTATSLPEGFFDDDDEDDNGDEDDSGFPKVVREWDCRILSKSPPKGTVIKGGTDFRAIWVVENTGTKTWPKKGVDVVFHSGARLHEGKPYYDIPATVGPGGKVTLTISMTAPKLSGTYSNRWALRVGNRDFCAVKFSIEVK